MQVQTDLAGRVEVLERHAKRLRWTNAGLVAFLVLIAAAGTARDSAPLKVVKSESYELVARDGKVVAMLHSGADGPELLLHGKRGPVATLAATASGGTLSLNDSAGGETYFAPPRPKEPEPVSAPKPDLAVAAMDLPQLKVRLGQLKREGERLTKAIESAQADFKKTIDRANAGDQVAAASLPFLQDGLTRLSDKQRANDAEIDEVTERIERLSK